MAVWLVARAHGARVPRRLVYVVDRRAVVDQATEEATKLRRLVDSDEHIKRSLGLCNRSLPISTVRGQHVDNREWLEDPASPAIVVGTVDMIGSRLLFEGYGVSRKMRPYHAGLLGVDTLVVLDEAHLVPPFEELMKSIASGAATYGARPVELQRLVPRFRLLALSATGRTLEGALSLEEKDLEHVVVRRRLEAKKHLTITPLQDETKLEGALAERAWELSERGSHPVRCLVFSDGREVAQKAKAALEKLAKGDKKKAIAEVDIASELLVGARRVYEREKLRFWLAEHGFLAGSDATPAKATFLFATSAGEVGIDLDADHMVCDLVAWERMVQRLGRVNRRGDHEEHVAKVVVLAESEPKPNKGTQAALEKRQRGEELKRTEKEGIERFEADGRARRTRLDALRSLPSFPSGADVFDASPGAFRELKLRARCNRRLEELIESATTPPPLRPALSRPLVDAWSMTSLEKHTGRPEVEPWLRGWLPGEPPVTAVVWRAHLPVRDSGAAASRKEVESFFEAAPPHASEVLETETFRVVEWLGERVSALRKGDPEEARPFHSTDVVAFALTWSGVLRETLRLDDLVSQDLEDRLKGALLILDSRLAGLKDGLLDATHAEIPSTADGADWLGDGVVRFRVRSQEVDAKPTPTRDWRERFRLPAELSEEGEVLRWLVVDKWRQDAATEEDRSAARLQLLDEHEEWAEKRARELATRVGLPPEYVDLLATAARLHDEGKRARCWQRAFRAPQDGNDYGKTPGPIDHALLDGYRHELGSLLRVADDERLAKLPEEFRELALHLIGAHHGFARPVIGLSGCDIAPPSVLEEKAREIALRFARLQKRWGPWGLAWWEALLRAADQQASRENDERSEIAASATAVGSTPP